MILVKDTESIVDEAIKKSKKLREFYLKARWKEIVGLDVCRRSQPVKLEEEILYIVADSSSVASYLRLSSDSVISKSNGILKDIYIKELKIKIGSISNGGCNE